MNDKPAYKNARVLRAALYLFLVICLWVIHLSVFVSFMVFQHSSEIDNDISPVARIGVDISPISNVKKQKVLINHINLMLCTLLLYCQSILIIIGVGGKCDCRHLLDNIRLTFQQNWDQSFLINNAAVTVKWGMYLKRQSLIITTLQPSEQMYYHFHCLRSMGNLATVLTILMPTRYVTPALILDLFFNLESRALCQTSTVIRKWYGARVGRWMMWQNNLCVIEWSAS